MQIILGVDISKQTFDVAVLRPGQPVLRRKFPNQGSGFFQLSQLLPAEGCQIVLALEATGRYGNALARFGFDLGWRVLVLNPARVKAYATSLGQRNKTDRADCWTIGLFAQNTPGLVPWVPPSAVQAQLRDLVRERLHVQGLLRAEQARAEGADAAAQSFRAARIQWLKEQQKELGREIQKLLQADPTLSQSLRLIRSIPGLGAWTAAVLLSELPPIDPKTKTRKIAALFGLCPRNAESGTSLRGGRLDGQGRRLLSHQLYMPALVALRHNAPIRAWAQQLRERGKTGKKVVAAVIHRLLRLAVGVLKSQTEFRADWRSCTS